MGTWTYSDGGDNVGAWIQKDGTKIAIADMTHSHLLNAHRMVCRRMAGLVEANEERKLATIISKYDDGLDIVAHQCSRKAKELESEIERRELSPLVETPQDKLFMQLERDVVKAQYEAYCSDHALPTGDMSDPHPNDIEAGPSVITERYRFCDKCEEGGGV